MTAKSYPLEVNLELDVFRTKSVLHFVIYSEHFEDFGTNINKVLLLKNLLSQLSIYLGVCAHGHGTQSHILISEEFFRYLDKISKYF